MGLLKIAILLTTLALLAAACGGELRDRRPASEREAEIYDTFLELIVETDCSLLEIDRTETHRTVESEYADEVDQQKALARAAAPTIAALGSSVNAPSSATCESGGHDRSAEQLSRTSAMRSLNDARRAGARRTLLGHGSTTARF